MSPSSSVLLLAKTITHTAARSLCDSWASCELLKPEFRAALLCSRGYLKSWPRSSFLSVFPVFDLQYIAHFNIRNLHNLENLPTVFQVCNRSGNFGLTKLRMLEGWVKSHSRYGSWEALCAPTEWPGAKSRGAKASYATSEHNTK